VAKRTLTNLSCETGNNFSSFHFASESILSAKESRSPGVEEFATSSFGDIGINNVSSFPVFIHSVKCVSVPHSDKVSLSIVVVIPNDLHHLRKSILKLPGDFRSSKYFLECVFTLKSDVFIKNLNHKFGYKHADSKFIATS
jgi:hypothetical protein